MLTLIRAFVMPEVLTMLETQTVASIPAETREPRVFDLRYLPWGSLLIIALLVFTGALIFYFSSPMSSTSTLPSCTWANG